MRSEVCRRFGAILSVLGILLWLTAGFYITVSADDYENSLTLVCQSDEVNLSGMQWKIYRVGSNQNGNYVLDGDFKDYRVSLEDLSAEGLSDVASTLENYAVVDKINPIATGITDENGAVTFEGLESGLYVISGKKLQIDYTYYKPVASLIEVKDGESVTAYPKFRVYRVLGLEDSEYTVKKVWQNDDETPQDRSVTITVEMYKDDEYDSTVILSEENDWTYTWTAQAHVDWRVKEIDIPDNYTVVYRWNELQYLIVNTHDEPEVETSQPTTSTTDTSTTTDTSITTDINTSTDTSITSAISNTVTSIITSSPTVSSQVATTVATTVTTTEKLPQTGQLWWPVPVMAGGGLVFISIGCRLRSKK